VKSGNIRNSFNKPKRKTNEFPPTLKTWIVAGWTVAYDENSFF